MADKMMRIAGRTDKGLAKSLSLDDTGGLRTIAMRGREYLGDFEEPYDDGYVGNVALLALEAYGKSEFILSEIADVKAGKSGVYVLQKNGTLSKLDRHLNELLWVYKNADPNIYQLNVDYNDNVIISSGTNLEHRITEKVDGQTGTRVWRDVDNSGNYIWARDVFIDLTGSIYTIGRAEGDSTSKKALFRKHSGSDGELMWSMVYEDLGAGPVASIAVRGSDIYIASRYSIRKINQSNANTTIEPTVVWVHPFLPSNRGIHPRLVIDQNNQMFMYTADSNDYYYLVKYDLTNTTQVTPPNETSRIRLDDKHKSRSYRPILDKAGNVYINDGKFDNNLKTIQNGGWPVINRDIRDGYLYGTKNTNGRYGENITEVYKLGLDLQIKGYKGIK